MSAAAVRWRTMMTVDAFSVVPYQGNPVAVVLDGCGLDTAQMQAFARWTRLSETTFIVPPTAQQQRQGADYALRIFSPAAEMDFAGHPTLGSCYAWLTHGGQPQRPDTIVQACHAGLVAIARSAHGLAFAAPAVRTAPMTVDMAAVYQALGLQACQVLHTAWLDVGTPWLCLHIDSAQAMLALQPDATRIAALAPLFTDDVGLGMYAFTGDKDYPLEVRAWTLTGEEDPVTGSLNACLADWLGQHGSLSTPYTARQGRSAGRNGFVRLTRDAQHQLWVGGDCALCVQARVLL